VISSPKYKPLLYVALCFQADVKKQAQWLQFYEEENRRVAQEQKEQKAREERDRQIRRKKQLELEQDRERLARQYEQEQREKAGLQPARAMGRDRELRGRSSIKY
jgi:hypothetical protein